MSASWTGDWLARTPIRKGEGQRYGEMPPASEGEDLTSESARRKRPNALEPNSGPRPRIGAFEPVIRAAGATDGVVWTGDWLGKYSEDQPRDPDGRWSGMGADAARAHSGENHGGPGHTIEHASYAADGRLRQVPFGEADRGARATHMQMEHGDHMGTGPISSVAHDAAHARIDQATARHMGRAERASNNDLAEHLTEHHDIHAPGGSTMDPRNAAALASGGRARMDDIHGQAHVGYNGTRGAYDLRTGYSLPGQPGPQAPGVRKYSDDQERGQDGKWTCGIDGCGSEQLSQSSLDEHQYHEHHHPGPATAGRDVPEDDGFRPPSVKKYSESQDRGNDGKWTPMGAVAPSGVGHHVPTNAALAALHGAMHGRDPLTPHGRDLALHHLSDAHGVHARTVDAAGRPVGSDASIHEAHAGAHRAGLD